MQIKTILNRVHRNSGFVYGHSALGKEGDRDVLAHMQFRPEVSPALRIMDAAIFTPGPMQLRSRPSWLSASP